jgi:hypothetical protein
MRNGRSAIFATIVCAASLFGSKHAAAEQDTYLTCLSGTGTQLCRQLDDISYLFQYRCTGDACYDVWSRQIRAIDAFDNLYRTVPYNLPATSDIGQRARDAAWYICNSTATGDCDWMQALFNAKAAALRSLVDVQQNAQISPVSCQVSYSCR